MHVVPVEDWDGDAVFLTRTGTYPLRSIPTDWTPTWRKRFVDLASILRRLTPIENCFAKARGEQAGFRGSARLTLRLFSRDELLPVPRTHGLGVMMGTEGR